MLPPATMAEDVGGKCDDARAHGRVFVRGHSGKNLVQQDQQLRGGSGCGTGGGGQR